MLTTRPLTPLYCTLVTNIFRQRMWPSSGRWDKKFIFYVPHSTYFRNDNFWFLIFCTHLHFISLFKPRILIKNYLVFNCGLIWTNYNCIIIFVLTTLKMATWVVETCWWPLRNIVTSTKTKWVGLLMRVHFMHISFRFETMHIIVAFFRNQISFHMQPTKFVTKTKLLKLLREITAVNTEDRTKPKNIPCSQSRRLIQ
jgi:hypothetical protein